MSFLRQLQEKNDVGEIPTSALPGSAGAADGQILVHDGAGGSDWEDPVGHLRQYSERLTTSNTAGGFVVYDSIITPVTNPAGTYLIKWWYVIKHSDVSGETDVNVRIAPGSAGPTQDINEPTFQGFTSYEMVDALNVYECSGQRQLVLFAGQQTIELRHARGTSGTSSMHNGSLSIERVPDP